MTKSLRKVVHEKLTITVFQAGDVKATIANKDAMTPEDAKRLLGWRSEKDPNEKEAFGDDYRFKDVDGAKIRLGNCQNNRPFRKGLALYYANEILRQKWRLNGETMSIDLTDDVQEGQHRLVGIIFAEQLRKKNPEPWKEYGTRGPVTVEAIVVTGISNEDDVVDTINLGQKRSLGDVLFRNHSFEKVTDKEQQGLANTLAGATRMAWICMGGRLVSDAPKFPHSEALDFIEKHPKLLDCVDHITVEDDGAEKQIRKFISLGYAAGLMYLMATSKTNTKKFDAGEEEPDTSLLEEAQKFWTLVASGASLEKGSPILILRNFLTSSNAGSGHERDEIIAAVKLAWVAHLDKKKLEGVKDLKPGRLKVKGSDKTVLDMPYIGGLDVKREAPPKAEKPVKPEGEKGKGKGKGKGKKGGKKVEYTFKEGDEVFVLPKGSKTDDLYEGRVREIKADGGVIVVPKTHPGMQCLVNPGAGDYVGHEKPKAA